MEAREKKRLPPLAILSVGLLGSVFVAVLVYFLAFRG